VSEKSKKSLLVIFLANWSDYFKSN